MDDNQIFDELAAIIFRMKNTMRTRSPKFPLRMPEMAVLMHISRFQREENRPITPSELSLLMHISRPAITPALNVLEEKGFIERVMCKEDRRSFQIVLTSKGAQVEEQMKSHRQMLFKTIIEKMGEDDATELIRLMKKTEQIIKEITNES